MLSVPFSQFDQQAMNSRALRKNFGRPVYLQGVDSRRVATAVSFEYLRPAVSAVGPNFRVVVSAGSGL